MNNIEITNFTEQIKNIKEIYNDSLIRTSIDNGAENGDSIIVDFGIEVDDIGRKILLTSTNYLVAKFTGEIVKTVEDETETTKIKGYSGVYDRDESGDLKLIFEYPGTPQDMLDGLKHVIRLLPSIPVEKWYVTNKDIVFTGKSTESAWLNNKTIPIGTPVKLVECEKNKVVFYFDNCGLIAPMFNWNNGTITNFYGLII